MPVTQEPSFRAAASPRGAPSPSSRRADRFGSRGRRRVRCSRHPGSDRDHCSASPPSVSAFFSVVDPVATTPIPGCPLLVRVCARFGRGQIQGARLLAREVIGVPASLGRQATAVGPAAFARRYNGLPRWYPRREGVLSGVAICPYYVSITYLFCDYRPRTKITCHSIAPLCNTFFTPDKRSQLVPVKMRLSGTSILISHRILEHSHDHARTRPA